MNFRRGQKREDPEINLIPFIDVLLVILIFLMITTTYSKFTELKITLPTAEAEKTVEQPNDLNVTVDAKGNYTINGTPVAFHDVAGLAEQMKTAAKDANPIVKINADQFAMHQMVINVMEAARVAGFERVTFEAQTAQAR
ncbi:MULTISPECIES: biopolymer transporter ExbD [unclassified Duganella]|uniref:ExbD/TolR family protein n=1 Tax=unclassified Duganella TaxID=2636909 RepID=UPI0006FE87F2|nr:MULTISPECIES: biopolymer transporter ExbD [unclassified Duganella]KQV45590.1 biopolymer transporter ExbD [Duganella sp. Root336D2]KRC00735.1 biopolymer transporter ExbD [Duganella sp. Root198D2]